MSGATHVVFSGPLVLAIPIAAAAGAVSFLSPCCLPLVPGYLSYVTGMSGADLAQPVAARAGRGRTLAGASLFVLGFAALFATYGALFGGLGATLSAHQRGLAEVLGALTIVLGLLFMGVFERFSLAGRVATPGFRPRAGLAGAPLLGVLFGLGWTPCIGPTLAAVMTMSITTGTAARGAFLAFVYALGLGIPFLIAAFAVQRGLHAFGFARRHARLIMRIGGAMLVVVGVAQVTGIWANVVASLQHWVSGYTVPL
jgi:cytochrome c-type biogenesis protein